MKTHLKRLVPALLLLTFCGVCLAGPAVVVHPKTDDVTIRDSNFDIVQVLKDPKKIKIVQDAFLRAKRIGDTTTKLKGMTHKIDFSDRWLIDIKSGEIGVLTKAVTDVYQLEAGDLAALKGLLKPKAEQASSHITGKWWLISEAWQKMEGLELEWEFSVGILICRVPPPDGQKPKGDEEIARFKYSVDATKTPLWITFTVTEEITEDEEVPKELGIFRIEGEELHLKFSTEARPAKFDDEFLRFRRPSQRK